MTENNNRYFLAIVPPPSICEEIITIQKDIADRFQTLASLKIIPHITLKSPFTIAENQHENVVNWFKTISISVAPFELELQNFNAFHNPKRPVIYIKPVENRTLSDLQKQIINEVHIAFPDMLITDLEQVYKPHITVAYRDLKPELFKKAWLEYSINEYYASFNVTDFQLLQHDGRRWNVIQNYVLNNSMQ